MRIALFLALLLTTVDNIFADIISKTDGTQIEAVILRVSDQAVEYKTEKIPFLTIQRSVVSRIQYKSGEIVDMAPKAGKVEAAAPALPVENTQPATGQKKRYSKAGTFEFGGSLSFTSFTFSGEKLRSPFASNAIYIFSIAPSASVFIFNQFSLGVMGSITTLFRQSGGSSQTSIAAYVNPAYTLDLKNSIFPYFGILFGYANSLETDSSIKIGGVGYGARIGVKFTIASDILLDCGVQYLIQNYSSGSTSPSFQPNYNFAISTLAFTVGFTTWL